MLKQMNNVLTFLSELFRNALILWELDTFSYLSMQRWKTVRNRSTRFKKVISSLLYSSWFFWHRNWQIIHFSKHGVIVFSLGSGRHQGTNWMEEWTNATFKPFSPTKLRELTETQASFSVGRDVVHDPHTVSIYLLI